MGLLSSKDPIGTMTLIFQALLIWYWFSGISGISPITNSTIANYIACSTCGPGGTEIFPLKMLMSAAFAIALIFLPLEIIFTMQDPTAPEVVARAGPTVGRGRAERAKLRLQLRRFDERFQQGFRRRPKNGKPGLLDKLGKTREIKAEPEKQDRGEDEDETT